MPTDQERIDQFHACIDKYNQDQNAHGGSLIIDALLGNFGSFVEDWVGFVAWAQQNHPDCYNILSPAQRAAIAQGLEARKAEAHETTLRGGRGPAR